MQTSFTVVISLIFSIELFMIWEMCMIDIYKYNNSNIFNFWKQGIFYACQTKQVFMVHISICTDSFIRYLDWLITSRFTQNLCPPLTLKELPRVKEWIFLSWKVYCWSAIFLLFPSIDMREGGIITHILSANWS